MAGQIYQRCVPWILLLLEMATIKLYSEPAVILHHASPVFWESYEFWEYFLQPFWEFWVLRFKTSSFITNFSEPEAKN